MKRLETGSELDGFAIGELVHSGGMAHIYRVTRADVDFPVVMKVPRMSQSDGAENLVSYEVEKTVHEVLHGPHVPRLVAVGDMARRPYLVMEWVEGRCLERWLEGERPSPEEIARIGVALATAAHSLHVQHAVHLDIKPANVVMRPDGRAVLIDFGLSHHDHFPDLLAEEMRPAVGSGPYISPEQVTGVRNEPRSDVYAIGVTLYELATRELPFGMPATPNAMRRRLWVDPVPPRLHNPDIPAWLQEVILRCMEPDPARRYPSAAQLALDLQHPDQIALTARAHKLTRAGWRQQFGAWLKASGWEYRATDGVGSALASAPIILVAVGTHSKVSPLVLDALRRTVQQALAAEPGARLTCVTVIPTTPLQTGGRDELSETSIHRRHLVALRHWAEPMRLPPERISLHVLESSDRAGALLEYIAGNHITQIIMGAPKKLTFTARMPAPLRIAQEATCSVHLVRPRIAPSQPLSLTQQTPSDSAGSVAPSHKDGP